MSRNNVVLLIGAVALAIGIVLVFVGAGVVGNPIIGAVFFGAIIDWSYRAATKKNEEGSEGQE